MPGQSSAAELLERPPAPPAVSKKSPLPSAAPESEQQAYYVSVRLSVSDIAGQLQEQLGQRLTALIVRAGDPKAVGRWARGERTPHAKTEQLLRTTYQVTVFLLSANSPAVVRAWFGGMNPLLDDHAPALVLADTPEDVLAAARDFVVNG